MNIPQNRLKSALGAGEVQHGLWLGLASGIVAELAGGAGFDWCLIDGEHGPNTVTEMVPQLQALAHTGTEAVVRIPVAETWMIKQVLDIGAQTVVVPMVDDAERAAEMAAAMRYPPDGNRGMGAMLARASGYNANADYIHQANDQMFLFVQAESAAAVANIDAIATTPGVDGVFIGPADLSADMGYPGQADHPEVVATIDHMIARIRAAGKVVGTITTDEAALSAYAKAGVTFLGVGADVLSLRAALVDLARRVKAF